ncbi:MAG: N4-gp56 family major capsid protein [Ignisphaera sp.]|nr:N4-gp56 family major capsid protein [Ignisphaera sp.]
MAFVSTSAMSHQSGISGATQLTPQLIEIYDKIRLTTVPPNQIWAKYGQQRFVPSGTGARQTYVYRWKNLPVATTPLTEGITPGGNTVQREKIQMRVTQFGSYMEYTDQLDLFDVMNIKTEFLDLQNRQSARTLDIIVRSGIIGGTNVIFANSAANRAAIIAAAKVSVNTGLPKEGDYARAALRLRKAKAEKYAPMLSANGNISTQGARSAYLCIIDPNRTDDLRYARNADGTLFYPNFLSIEQYPNQSAAEEYEVGRMGDLKFIESDEAAVDATDAAYPVYLDIVIGKNAYANVTVSGKGGIQTIIKPIGSAGASDPLDQRGTIGWKAMSGSRILNNTYMVRVEGTSLNGVTRSYENNTITDGGTTITADPGTGAGSGLPLPTGTATA